RILAGLQEAMALLHDDDHAASARLSRAAAILRGLARLDPECGEPVEGLETASAHIEEAVTRVRALRERAAAEPDRLTEIDARLEAISSLKRKYGETVPAILSRRRAIAEALERIAAQDFLVADAERNLANVAKAAAAEAAV